MIVDIPKHLSYYTSSSYRPRRYRIALKEFQEIHTHISYIPHPSSTKQPPHSSLLITLFTPRLRPPPPPTPPPLHPPPTTTRDTHPLLKISSSYRALATTDTPLHTPLRCTRLEIHNQSTIHQPRLPRRSESRLYFPGTCYQLRQQPFLHLILPALHQTAVAARSDTVVLSHNSPTRTRALIRISR